MNSFQPLYDIYPQVISQTPLEHHSLGLHTQIDFFVGRNIRGFAGHFPQFALLPGVVQIDWASHYARDAFELTGSVVSVERLKFTCPIRPESAISLALTLRESCIEFRYFHRITSDRTQEFSRGRLVFA